MNNWKYAKRCSSTLTTIEFANSHPHTKSVSALTFQLPLPRVFWETCFSTSYPCVFPWRGELRGVKQGQPTDQKPKRFTILQFIARLDKDSLTNNVQKSRKLPTNTTEQSESRAETMYFNIRWVMLVNVHASLAHVPVTSPAVTLTLEVLLDLFPCDFFGGCGGIAVGSSHEEFLGRWEGRIAVLLWPFSFPCLSE